jgi:hypothetical protein
VLVQEVIATRTEGGGQWCHSPVSKDGGQRERTGLRRCRGEKKKGRAPWAVCSSYSRKRRLAKVTVGGKMAAAGTV